MITDLKYLQQMTGNDIAVMKEMIEMFLHQLAEVRADIELLVENKNWTELSRLAHKIKSSALVMGVGQMADEMKELELLAKESKNVESYPDYVARFNTMTDLAEVELKTYLDSSGN
jgi:HPt (histidine-containing phosphotransfer) domain-containing protein